MQVAEEGAGCKKPEWKQVARQCLSLRRNKPSSTKSMHGKLGTTSVDFHNS